jgi:hypothetical protein
LSNLSDAVRDVPVHVREVGQEGFRVTGSLFLEAGVSIDPLAILRLNDGDLAEGVREQVLQDPPPATRASGRQIWQPAGSLIPPWFIRDVNDKAWYFDDLEISYALTEHHFFGYLRDLETVMHLRNEANEDANVLLPAEALRFDYATDFARFDSAEDLPVEPSISVGVAVLAEDAAFVHPGTFIDLVMEER